MKLAAILVSASVAAAQPCIFADPAPTTAPTLDEMYADLLAACGLPFVGLPGAVTAACEYAAVYPWWESVRVQGRPCEEGWPGYVMRILACR